MKNIFLFLLFLSFGVHSFSFAAIDQQEEYQYASEESTASGTQIIVPDDISWTDRFILTELKDLRIDLERHQRDVANTINSKELQTVDRALSYSANTVNFFFVILTLAAAAFGIFGWRTMKDVKENLAKNFENRVQSEISVQQEKLEEFMQNFKSEQLAQSEEILKNQELIQHKQEGAYYWSQFNREENPASKLELLDKILSAGLEENELFVYIERSSIYVELALWDKVIEAVDKGLEISSDNTVLLYNKASALVMSEEMQEAVNVLSNVIGVNPGMKEEILEDPMFENIVSQLEEYISNQEV